MSGAAELVSLFRFKAEALERRQQESDQPFHTVLRFRADHPDLNSTQLAEKLSEQLGKRVTDNWVRQVLFRARKIFAEFLLDDITHSLDDPAIERIKEELLDLGLLEYCEPTLEQRRRVP